MITITPCYCKPIDDMGWGPREFCLRCCSFPWLYGFNNSTQAALALHQQRIAVNKSLQQGGFPTGGPGWTHPPPQPRYVHQQQPGIVMQQQQQQQYIQQPPPQQQQQQQYIQQPPPPPPPQPQPQIQTNKY